MNRSNLIESLSATIELDEISDADQNDIKKILDDTSDLDDTLFKRSNSKQQAEPAGLSKTLPAALDKNKPTNLMTSQKTNSNNRSFNMDDPLDDMDSFFGKTAPPRTSRSVSFDLKPPVQNKNLSNTVNLSTKKNQLSFDDDDFFLNDTKPPPPARKSADDAIEKKPGPKEDFNLFGGANEPSREAKDDTFKLGSYVPTLGSARSNKQDVFKKNESFSFDDDHDFLAPTKTSNPPTSKGGTLKNDLDFDLDFESLLKPKSASGSQKKPQIVEHEKPSWLEDPKTTTTSRNRPPPPLQSQMGASNETKLSLNETLDTGVNNIPPLKYDTSPVRSTSLNLEKSSMGFDVRDGGYKDLDSKPTRKSTLENANQSSGDFVALSQKIQQLEYEIQELNMQLAHQKSHYESKIALTNETCEERVKMMREDRETLVRHHNEAKSALQTQIDMLEKQKNEILVNSKQKLEEREREFAGDLEKQRQSYREAVERLKADYDEQFERLKRSHEAEKRSMMQLGEQSNTIENVVGMIEGQARTLSEMHFKVERGHASNLKEVEVQLRAKEELLKAHEHRLILQQKEYENEIRVLNETIRKLEAHLAEQIKNVDEERWRSKQQEKKLEALQEALVNEQRLVMDKFARERHEIERTREDTLSEQKRLVKQIYEEKCRLAEERANLEAMVAAHKDKIHKDSITNINNEAEMSVGLKRLKDEQLRLEKYNSELNDKENRLKRERVELDEKRHELETKMSNLEKMAISVHQKHFEAEELLLRSTKERDAQKRILDEVNLVKQGHESRLNQIQQQLNILRDNENQINQEKIEIYRQRQMLEQFKSTITCSKCREPLKNYEFPGFIPPVALFNQMSMSRLRSSASPLTATINGSDLEDAKQIRQLKLQAYRDKQFLNEEKHFIDTISGFNHLKSMSMNHLNTTIG